MGSMGEFGGTLAAWRWTAHSRHRWQSWLRHSRAVLVTCWKCDSQHPAETPLAVLVIPSQLGLSVTVHSHQGGNGSDGVTVRQVTRRVMVAREAKTRQRQAGVST